MQNSQMATITQVSNNMPVYNASKVKQEFSNVSNFCDTPMAEMSNQMHSFMSPSNSSTSFNAAPMATADTVSSVVNMLKGTLERKKLNNKGEKELMEGCSYNFFSSQEALPNITSTQGPGNQGNQAHMGSASQEPSNSESSTAAPALSTGFEVCDGPTHSGHTISNGVCSSRHGGDGTPDYELKANECRERIHENGYKDSTKVSNYLKVETMTFILLSKYFI